MQLQNYLFFSIDCFLKRCFSFYLHFVMGKEVEIRNHTYPNLVIFAVEYSK